jgi:hypothetical protein
VETAREAVIERLSGYDSLLEVGIGRRPEVARGLAGRGRSVTAIDVDSVPVPASVRFRVDDIVARSEADDPGETYRVDALYGLNLPPELHRPTRDLARRVRADFLFTTLGYDEPAVPVEREPLPAGETLYVARTGTGPDGRS